MSDPYSQKPDLRKFAIIFSLLIGTIIFFALRMFGFFDEPEELEGIIVRFMLFFKQSTLI